MKQPKCDRCGSLMEEGGYATQVHRRHEAVVTITGIPAVRVCLCCQNAVLEWPIAQEVEDLIKPLFQWMDTHSLPSPYITVVFPTASPVRSG